MNTQPFLSRNMVGERVVVYFVPLELPGHYAVRLRPADKEDLLMLESLKSEPETEEVFFE